MELSEAHLRQRLSEAKIRELRHTETTPFAAVAAVLRYVHDEPDIILIRRAEHPGDLWSGHMAFPGGRQDAEDLDLLRTAKRETKEEVGVDLSTSAELIGRLDDVQAMSRAGPGQLVIVPYVFVLRGPVQLRPEVGEVAEALWTPLGPMARGETRTTRPYKMTGIDMHLPAFAVGEHVVWGLTHRMLENLFQRLR